MGRYEQRDADTSRGQEGWQCAHVKTAALVCLPPDAPVIVLFREGLDGSVVKFTRVSVRRDYPVERAS